MKNLKILGSILFVFIIVYSCNNLISKNLRNKIKKELAAENISRINNHSNIENENESSNCERKLFFDGTNFCFPKIDKWKECRNDKDLKDQIDRQELNNKILAYYVPNDFYEKLKTEAITNYPVIALFVQTNTIGAETTKNALPMFFEGLKNNYEFKNLSTIENQLKNYENVEFVKPLLFDNYDISNNIKTGVTISSFKTSKDVSYKLSFFNVIDLNKRIIIVNYLKITSKDLKYNLIKDENYKIINQIINVN